MISNICILIILIDRNLRKYKSFLSLMCDSVMDLQNPPNCSSIVTLWTRMRVVEMNFQMILQIFLSCEGLETLQTSPLSVTPLLHQLLDLLADFSVYMARNELC